MYEDTPPCTLAVLRRMRGMNQTYLAALLKVSQGDVSEWENGHSYPSPGRAETLKRVLGWGGSVERLLGPWNHAECSRLIREPRLVGLSLTETP